MKDKPAWISVAILIFILLGGYIKFVNKKIDLQQTYRMPAVAGVENINREQDCTEITPVAEEGPYYVTDTKQLANNLLNFTNLPGIPIKISGHVYSGVSSTPVPNAIIELWQADSNGKYHPNSNGEESKYSDSEIALRGYILTDQNGYFEFKSIYPGFYENRARHIHARITADKFKDVTTQIIFPDKNGLNNDEIALSLPACHVLKMTPENGFESGTIDFRLQPTI